MAIKKILFFYPPNKRSVAIETSMLELKKKGHKVLLLTTADTGDLHEYLQSFAIETFSMYPKKGYFNQAWALIRFCRAHRIDFVFSHLQPANFVSVLSQAFIRAKVVIFRHHLQSVNLTDDKIDVHHNEIRMDQIINRFARKIIVPSSGVYTGMKRFEKIDLKKLAIIPYIYDFSKYQIPDEAEVRKIKQQYPCKLRLIMVSRLIRLKRHHIVFPVVKELVSQGYDLKMLVLDEGPEKETLDRYIHDHQLNNVIFMLGYKKDFVNYMAASDLLIQPSLTDASNSVAKEMALFEKPVAVSENVGDYSDYVRHKENGYLIPVTNSASHLKEIIVDAYTHPHELQVMGKLLKKEVISRFGVDGSSEIINLYEELLK